MILCTLSSQQIDGQRKAIGRKVLREISIAIDPLNLCLCSTTNGAVTGIKYFPSFEKMSLRMSEFGVDPELSIEIINNKLSEVFGFECKLRSWKEIDRDFSTGSRHTSGAHRGEYLHLYDKCKAFFGIDEASEVDEVSEVEVEV